MDLKAKLLYIDDEETNLEIFFLNFRKKYEVFTALDEDSGIRILEENSDIRVIFCDMRMPLMTGIEFIQLAKSRFPNNKYFILTGFEISVEIQHAIEQGLVHQYFSKPFNKKELELAIESALDSFNN